MISLTPKLMVRLPLHQNQKVPMLVAMGVALAVVVANRKPRLPDQAVVPDLAKQQVVPDQAVVPKPPKD